MAREQGFGNINCDLIAGLPSETTEDFRGTIEQITQLNPESITVHTMSFKEHQGCRRRTVLLEPKTIRLPLWLKWHGHACGKQGRAYYLYRQKKYWQTLKMWVMLNRGLKAFTTSSSWRRFKAFWPWGQGQRQNRFPDNRIERIFNVKMSSNTSNVDEMLKEKHVCWNHDKMLGRIHNRMS